MSGSLLINPYSFVFPSVAVPLIYTGDGQTERIINGLPFTPNMLWFGSRSHGGTKELFDSVRGVTKIHNTDDPRNEITDTDELQAFLSGGFEIDDGTRINTNGKTYVVWAWDKRPAAGLDIVQWTGTGVGGKTVALNLNAAPHMVWVKTSVFRNWRVFHIHANNSVNPEDQVFKLDLDSGVDERFDAWDRTLPTATVLTLGDSDFTNKLNDPYTAYAFAPVEGRSFFGKFSGTAAEQSITGLGFQPGMVLIKKDNGSDDWWLYDKARGATKGIRIDTTEPETTNAESLKSFDEDGFTLGTFDEINGAAKNFIFGAWK